MGDFGGKLRQARERRGVSLRQVSSATKISVGVLEALERNDISRLPGGIFSRGLVRAYAEQIGADPESTVEDFIARFPDASVSDGLPHLRSEEVNTDPPSMVARRVVMAVAILLPIALIVVLSILVRMAGW